MGSSLSPPSPVRSIILRGITTSAAHPDAVAVEIGGRQIQVRPRVVEGAERAELWQLVNDNYNGYEVYQGRAGGRVIPVVLLER
jgi:hypothetical protein